MATSTVPHLPQEGIGFSAVKNRPAYAIASVDSALLLAGLRSANIHTPGPCTADHVDRFYSHRAEEGRAGRFMAVLGLRNT